MTQRPYCKFSGAATAFSLLLLSAVFPVELGLIAQPSPVKPAAEVRIKSTKDGTQQPALLYVPPGAAATDRGSRVPLLVFLHSWSNDYKTTGGVAEALGECRHRGWAFLSPDFRGVNDHPEACASDLAVEDVLDSVNYAKQQARVDEKRVYLLGSSGGGHMALVMAERASEVWAAVSVWVPIVDLAAWYQFSKATGSQYFPMMEKCCGGAPGPRRRISSTGNVHRSLFFQMQRGSGSRLTAASGTGTQERLYL